MHILLCITTNTEIDMTVLNRAIKLVHMLKDDHQVGVMQQDNIEYSKNNKVALEQLLHEIRGITQS